MKYEEIQEYIDRFLIPRGWINDGTPWAGQFVIYLAISPMSRLYVMNGAGLWHWEIKRLDKRDIHSNNPRPIDWHYALSWSPPKLFDSLPQIACDGEIAVMIFGDDVPGVK